LPSTVGVPRAHQQLRFDDLGESSLRLAVQLALDAGGRAIGSKDLGLVHIVRRINDIDSFAPSSFLVLLLLLSSNLCSSNQLPCLSIFIFIHPNPGLAWRFAGPVLQRRPSSNRTTRITTTKLSPSLGPEPTSAVTPRGQRTHRTSNIRIRSTTKIVDESQFSFKKSTFL